MSIVSRNHVPALSPVHEDPREESEPFSPSSAIRDDGDAFELHLMANSPSESANGCVQIEQGRTSADSPSMSISSRSASVDKLTSLRLHAQPTFFDFESWLDQYDMSHLHHTLSHTLGLTMAGFAEIPRKNVRRLIFSDDFKSRFTNAELMTLFQAVLELHPLTVSSRQHSERVAMSDEEQQIMIRVRQDTRGIQEAIEGMEDLKRSIDEAARIRERFIQERIEECVSMLRQHEEVLVGQVQEIVSLKSRMLDDQLQQLRDQVPVFEHASEVQQRILKYEDMGQVARKVSLQEISDSMHQAFGELNFEPQCDAIIPVEFNVAAFENGLKQMCQVSRPNRAVKQRRTTTTSDMSDAEPVSPTRRRVRRSRSSRSLIAGLKVRRDADRVSFLDKLSFGSPILHSVRGGSRSPPTLSSTSSTDFGHLSSSVEFSELPRRSLRSLDVATCWSQHFRGDKLVVAKSNPQICKSRRGLGWCANSIRVQDPLPRDSVCSWRIVFHHSGYPKGQPIQQSNFIGVVGEMFSAFDQLVCETDKRFVCGIDCDGKNAYTGDGSETQVNLEGRIGWNEEIAVHFDGEMGRIQFWNETRDHLHLVDLVVPDEGFDRDWYPAVSLDVPGNVRCQITFV